MQWSQGLSKEEEFHISQTGRWKGLLVDDLRNEYKKAQKETGGLSMAGVGGEKQGFRHGTET